MQNNMKIYLLFAFILIGLSSTEIDNSAQKISSKRILRKADLKTILKIQFCQSWSSAGYFRHVKEQLELLFSDVSVVPEQYPLKNPRKTIYYIMIALQIIFVILIIISDLIKSKLEFIIGVDFFKSINENKMTYTELQNFIGLYIGQIIYNTGAFEVFCDDKLIWSTIEKNGIKPSLKTIIQLVKNVE